MKSSIKTCSAKSTGLAKLVICTAVILSLGFTANLSAGPTIFLDADTLAAGGYTASSPLVITTPYGNVTFVGEIKIGTSDPDFAAAGASGGTFDILGPHDSPAGDQTAELFFDFDVLSLEKFIFGGNEGSILIEARDEYGGVVDSFDQGNTYDGWFAGPITLSGSGIRSLYWKDTTLGEDYAALDNILITIIPSPSAVVLTGIGVSFVGWLRKRRIV